ncbi:ATP/GTP-binding protein [Nonomuraea basaltis]|uniref:ATP/GTP-binding protein n=1 Tax=Nonomuraea basaltis TaxID=2495887 RepID=UPI00110C4700|nr:ATP/GTP-binding protein [Nonomuraea basaltis]TMR90648.1 ATP/GTP-binding protein [Nonomuraea basaltis]
MSPRRARRRESSRPFGFPTGLEKVEEWPDGEWKVRMLNGASSSKDYRCPGCDHEIRSGQPHLVAWPNWRGGDEERRHWHSACWRKRLDRGPGRSRY